MVTKIQKKNATSKTSDLLFKTTRLDERGGEHRPRENICVYYGMKNFFEFSDRENFRN